MKIPIPIPGFRRYLNIERKYHYRHLIIPAGCDCHPAHVLLALNMRKLSLPFDWLNTKPVIGINYVYDNMQNEFRNFISDLKKNDSGHVVSAHYPHAEFMHEEHLLEDEAAQAKFKRRTGRFLDLYRSRACCFLYNITSESLITAAEVATFVDSVRTFMGAIKASDCLSIYIRYDESFEENKENCEALVVALKGMDRVSVSKYIRYKGEKGIWGDERHYPQLLRETGIRVKAGILPRVYLSR